MTVKKISLVAATAFAVFMLAVSANADFTMQLPKTGVDYTPISGGGVKAGYDNNWTSAYLGTFGIGVTDNDIPNHTNHNGSPADLNALAASAANATFTNTFVYNNNAWPLGANNPWVVQGDANWVGDNGSQYMDGGMTTNTAGYYAYSIDFDIAEAAEYYLFGKMLSDNTLVGVMLDGQSFLDFTYAGLLEDAGITFNTGQNFLVDGTFALDAGAHNLTFLVSNYAMSGNQGNPTGMYVDVLSLSTTNPAVPEPATMLIFGVGLIGAGWVARRRNKK